MANIGIGDDLESCRFSDATFATNCLCRSSNAFASRWRVSSRINSSFSSSRFNISCCGLLVLPNRIDFTNASSSAVSKSLLSSSSFFPPRMSSFFPYNSLTCRAFMALISSKLSRSAISDCDSNTLFSKAFIGSSFSSFSLSVVI